MTNPRSTTGDRTSSNLERGKRCFADFRSSRRRCPRNRRRSCRLGLGHWLPSCRSRGLRSCRRRSHAGSRRLRRRPSSNSRPCHSTLGIADSQNRRRCGQQHSVRKPSRRRLGDRRRRLPRVKNQLHRRTLRLATFRSVGKARSRGRAGRNRRHTRKNSTAPGAVWGHSGARHRKGTLPRTAQRGRS